MSQDDEWPEPGEGYATAPLAYGVEADRPRAMTDDAVVDADAPLGLTQAPFAGLLTFAELVSQTRPGVGGVIAGTAYVAQAAVEEQIPLIAADIREQLGQSLSQAGRDACEISAEALQSEALPLTAQAIGAQFQDAFSEVLQAYASPNQLSNKVIDTILDSDLMLEYNGRARYNEVRDHVKQIMADTKRKPLWEAYCSLELPSVLNQNTPLQCARVKGSRTLDAIEHPFRGEPPYNAFRGNVTQPGPVGAITDYIDDPLFTTYRDQIPATGTILSYALQPIETPKNAAKAWIGGFVGQWKKGHKVEIQGIVKKHQKSAEQLVGTALGAVGLSTDLAGPVVKALTIAVEKIVNFILDRIAHAWGDVLLTPWTIVHTAIMGTDCVPISIFTLSAAARGHGELCRLDTGVPDPSQGSARYLIGPSTLPVASFDPRYFDDTARSGQPLAWQEPLESHTGFRVLVPHLDRELVLDRAGRKLLRKGNDMPYKELSALSKRLYVSAIRTDVLCWTRQPFAQPPVPGQTIAPARRRPTS